MSFCEYDRVRLRHDLPEHQLKAGTSGTVMIVCCEFEPPRYEVEFRDEEGWTLALITVQAGEIEKVEK